MNINLRDGIHLDDGKGNRFDTAKRPRDLTLEADLKAYAARTGMGVAQTANGIVTARTQAEADRIASLAELDDGRIGEVSR